MPKSIIIAPERVFSREVIRFSDIPVNAYATSLKEELANYSKEDLVSIWLDMCAIREFETILGEIKTKGTYKGVAYTHAGPAHLSIGQEAAAVGMAFLLGPEDHVFGSHRSHGEILAKGFSAIRQLSDEQLFDIMRSYRDGALLAPVERGHAGTVKSLARRFFVYGAYGEVFARDTGFNRGLGGSMHAFFTPFGIYPNNAIVGGSGSMAPGAALFKRVNRKPGIVVANIGDSSFGCGPVWEGITFSAMDQYRTLWDQALGGGLPIIFNCMNNFYGMGGQTLGETMGIDAIARIGAGVNPEQMHAERINGYDPFPVIDAFRRKKQTLQEGRGPTVLDLGRVQQQLLRRPLLPHRRHVLLPTAHHGESARKPWLRRRRSGNGWTPTAKTMESDARISITIRRMSARPTAKNMRTSTPAQPAGRKRPRGPIARRSASINSPGRPFPRVSSRWRYEKRYVSELRSSPPLRSSISG